MRALVTCCTALTGCPFKSQESPKIQSSQRFIYQSHFSSQVVSVSVEWTISWQCPRRSVDGIHRHSFQFLQSPQDTRALMTDRNPVMTSTSTFGSRKQSIHIYVTGVFCENTVQTCPRERTDLQSVLPDHLTSTRLHEHSVLQDVSSQHDDVGS